MKIKTEVFREGELVSTYTHPVVTFVAVTTADRLEQHATPIISVIRWAIDANQDGDLTWLNVHSDPKIDHIYSKVG